MQTGFSPKKTTLRSTLPSEKAEIAQKQQISLKKHQKLLSTLSNGFRELFSIEEVLWKAHSMECKQHHVNSSSFCFPAKPFNVCSVLHSVAL